MGLLLITPPESIPVSFAELRDHCEIAVDDTSHDAKLSRFASAATEYLERHTRRSFVTQSFRWGTAAAKVFYVPRPPLQSVESIKLIGLDGEEQTLDESDYQVSSDPFPGRIEIDDSVSMAALKSIEPVQIEFTAGYGGPETVPDSAKLVILQLTAFYFENRGDVSAQIPQSIRDAIAGMSSGTKAYFYAGKI